MDLVWPAVAVFCALLAFVRTRPKDSGAHAVIGPMIDRIAKLESTAAASTTKALVDRLNVLSDDMMAVKPRVIELEVAVREVTGTVSSMKTSTALKKMTGAST